jgi:hypothetical protein
MAARCRKPQQHSVDGHTMDTLACCRVAGHDGPCCRHFSGRIASSPHTTIHRGSDHLLIRCGRGEVLDAE